uniref:non-specific serine/threonine protein kinase n=1 Tax=Leersia perrieri TaxID=77586 RepID=A0A0D9XA90_9ORYZ
MEPLLLLRILLLAAVSASAATAAEAARDGCSAGCDIALASFYVTPNQNVTNIANLFGLTGPTNYRLLAPYNPNIPDLDFINQGDRVNVYFRCGCVSPPTSPSTTYLAGVFNYTVPTGSTYTSIANNIYSNLTTPEWLQATNTYPANNIPDNSVINITINCSCGDINISPDYGFFLTYPLSGRDTLDSVAGNYGLSSQLDVVRRYNPGMESAVGRGLVYIPVKGFDLILLIWYTVVGYFRSPWKLPTSEIIRAASVLCKLIMILHKGKGSSAAPIAGGVVAGVVALALGILYIFYRRRKAKQATLLLSSEDSTQLASIISTDKVTPSTTQAGGPSPVAGITVDKSVEFSYGELFNATQGFSIGNKIGQGGFGAVYYAELRGEKAAIKKMDMQATHEFLAELKVLTHVHHLNLVRLIGYCTESSLFLVYEFIENGNLSQHLRGTGYEPLSWAARVQIALDSARGLEYIHEHTVPVYIHRDIKSLNILIDKNYRAKVADFGLTKLTEVGGTSLPTRVVGTFGYMPPEYARYGDVSPKVDVYAFGVVLYELISAKEAIVRSTESASDSKGLVYLFEEALNVPDPKEGLRTLIDPKLGEDYPIDSVLKMTQLAKVCTQEDPKLRPSMRSVVVALMTLSSTSEFWDMNNLYENQGLVNLMSGR